MKENSHKGARAQRGKQIQFRLNPRLVGVTLRGVPGHGSYLRGFTYATSAKDWAGLAKLKDGKIRVFVKTKGE